MINFFVLCKQGQLLSIRMCPVNQTYGDAPFSVSTAATSGLPVTFSCDGSCSLSGAAVTIAGASNCVIVASSSLHPSLQGGGIRLPSASLLLLKGLGQVVLLLRRCKPGESCSHARRSDASTSRLEIGGSAVVPTAWI